MIVKNVYDCLDGPLRPVSER